jgi:GntR family transcriptional repressor for pyruvate dehydrogenase complex
MKKIPLSTQISEKLSNIILVEEKYKPNEQLPNERELAELLGASRTSIREATKLLEERGIVTIRRGIGTFVTSTPGIQTNPLGIDSTADTISTLEDWYRVRMILEGEAMEMVAANATDEELCAIRSIMEEENVLANKADSDFMLLDQSFHCSLARASHNIIIERLIPSLHASVYYNLVRSLNDRLRPKYNKNAKENHELIQRNLEMRDGKGANIAMRYHMLIAIEDVLSLR